jgi:hypothetical protein
MRIVIFIAILTMFSSCDWAKQKAKNTVHKTGEVVAEAGSEFADGVKKGVSNSFSNMAIVTDSLSLKGVRLGKIAVNGTDSTSDNVFSAYIIFEKGFDGKITAKALDKEGIEFGRAFCMIKVTPGDAGYFDFRFDSRTNIDREDKIILY